MIYLLSLFSIPENLWNCHVTASALTSTVSRDPKNDCQEQAPQYVTGLQLASITFLLSCGNGKKDYSFYKQELDICFLVLNLFTSFRDTYFPILFTLNTVSLKYFVSYVYICTFLSLNTHLEDKAIAFCNEWLLEVSFKFYLKSVSVISFIVWLAWNPSFLLFLSTKPSIKHHNLWSDCSVVCLTFNNKSKPFIKNGLLFIISCHSVICTRHT